MALSNLYVAPNIDTEALLATLDLPGEPDAFFKALRCPVCDFHHYDADALVSQVRCHRCKTRFDIDASGGEDELSVQVVADDETFSEQGPHIGWRRIPGGETEAVLRRYENKEAEYRAEEWSLVNADSDAEGWEPYDDSAYYSSTLFSEK